ncbi:MAG: hypothetical protein Dasosvirus3_3 [Dasosvirus sp.]|uniref:Uncharacterized protein n=1 Tax=Dasosvirus sp. TaxID=2487764 RepID=A0A3G4ZSZ9_9VIRU|nr:MAG: hypothetical protein Dasosvirus3_3 [Dasosvirus sp.]
MYQNYLIDFDQDYSNESDQNNCSIAINEEFNDVEFHLTVTFVLCVILIVGVSIYVIYDCLTDNCESSKKGFDEIIDSIGKFWNSIF